MTSSEVAAALGVTRQRVHQLHDMLHPEYVPGPGRWGVSLRYDRARVLQVAATRARLRAQVEVAVASAELDLAPTRKARR